MVYTHLEYSEIVSFPQEREVEEIVAFDAIFAILLVTDLYTLTDPLY